MIINTPISFGELLDKISILKIKKEKITENLKQIKIIEELNLLEKILNNILIRDKEIEKFLNKLIVINSKLWEIEDKIRNCERKKIFDKGFIELARSVYFTNDERSKIKLEINNKYGSSITEVKSYEKY